MANEPGAPSTCGIHVSVGRTRKYTGKDTWSPVNRAQRGYPPRETARFTARLRSNVLSHENRFFLLQPGPGRSHLLLTLQFPVERQDFRESKDPFLVRLKPLVRHERARSLRLPHPPPFHLFTRGYKREGLLSCPQPIVSLRSVSAESL